MPALRTRETQSRTLEVTADAPQPPTFNIVSPTPRAFTFPVTNNLSDSPYSSRSNSPFESSDLRSFPSQCIISSSCSSLTPPPTYMRTETPSAQLAVDLQRRKSTSSDSPERRPKKGEEDYIKRPENAFILFRRKCCEDRQAAQEEEAVLKGPAKKQRQADLSKTISQQWKSLSAEERKEWENLAKNKKLEHEKRYPNYVYRPQRAKDKDGRTKSNKKVKKLDYDESASMSFIVPVPRPHGRSASAPSPPSFQSIQIPNVYHMAPCPTSPSLLPMISRRSAFPGHPEDSASSFDFVPNNSFVHPSYSMSGQFEALQSSEFLRSMLGTSDQQQRSSGSPLQQLTMPGSPETPALLPAHQIISPSSSVGSGSSGPSSPLSGPYTPTSSLLTQNFTHHAPDASLEAQAQAEMDLQLEMQMQQEFAAFTWEGNHNSVWSSEPSILMGDDFDINAIRPVELGLSLPKYSESVSMMTPQFSGLEFGQDFSHALDDVHYPDDSRGLGILNFDEMMAGHSF